jgi:hypothetical protein
MSLLGLGLDFDVGCRPRLHAVFSRMKPALPFFGLCLVLLTKGCHRVILFSANSRMETDIQARNSELRSQKQKRKLEIRKHDSSLETVDR